MTTTTQKIELTQNNKHAMIGPTEEMSTRQGVGSFLLPPIIAYPVTFQQRRVTLPHKTPKPCRVDGAAIAWPFFAWAGKRHRKMIYAYHEGQKIYATPGARAICPECNEIVIARCGKINIWHWAHKQRSDCDLWSEHETQWHLEWKNYWPSDYVEVPIERNGIKHRADICTPKGIVIELQHSPISPDEISEREQFYGEMIWLFDVQIPYDDDYLEFRDKRDYYSFRWKHPRKHLAYVQKLSYWDIGIGGLFLLKKMYPSAPCGGWGNFINKDWFIQHHGGQVP